MRRRYRKQGEIPRVMQRLQWDFLGIFYIFRLSENAPMPNAGILTLILIIITILVSNKGFSNSLFFDTYKFEVDRILINKDYKRLLTSGFLHVSWMHLIFNMFSLYLFSGVVEMTLGSLNFLIIFFSSLIGGGLLSLLVHKNHGDYSSVGASGAICGVMFASVAIFPDMGIGLFFPACLDPGLDLCSHIRIVQHLWYQKQKEQYRP